MQAFKNFIKPFELLQKSERLQIELVFILIRLSEIHHHVYSFLSVSHGSLSLISQHTRMSFARKDICALSKKPSQRASTRF